MKISRRFPAAVIAHSVLMRNVSRSTWSHAVDCWGFNFIIDVCRVVQGNKERSPTYPTLDRDKKTHLFLKVKSFED